ncbi:unnamed protein product [Cuscuta campestris]|uniref:Chromo domain-containing protein n=1 Tax=Cuscuta campestris TaxID=132261 RepID=A0A484NLZ2_9ASTE|nr:unnamed protein product [Cuscuta campestris]
MTDASSTTADLEAKVGEMGHAVHQMQRDFDFRLTRIDAALAAMQTNLAALQVGGGGRVGRHGDDHEGPRNGETPPEERLRCVTMMLEGPAADWFRWRRNNGLIDGWEDFVEKFKLRFDPLHYVDYLGQLARVRQVGGVMDYQAAFERVLTHVTDVPEQHLQSLFHAGLKNHLQHEISLLKPTTLSASFALARELEAKHNAIVQSVGSRSGSWNPNASRSFTPGGRGTQHGGSNSTLGKPSILGSPPAVSTNSRESTASTLIRLLSRAEKMEKDAKGLCYNCDKKWSRDHKCGRFVLMMGEEEGDDEEPDMEEEVDVTADISSLHIDLYVLQIHGHDVVLGVQWLRQLGRVAHDYEKVTMEFTWLGQGVTLRGESPTAKLMTFNQLRTLHASKDVEAYVELMAIQETKQDTPDPPLPAAITQLLDEFGAVFEEPKGMPPRRDADHRIFLQPGTKPVNVHPYRFRIEYKTGASNRVADALSRIHDTSEEVHTLLTISVPVSSLMAELQQENQVQEDLVKRHREHQQGELAEPYSVVDGLLYHGRRLCVSSTSPLRVQLIKEHHDTVMAGHPGVQRTFLRLAQIFFWPKMRAEVREYVGRPQPLPDEFLQGQPVSKPVRVHASRQILRRGKLVQQYLVEWSDGTREDATWEPSEVVRHFYPDVHLEDKVFSQDGGSDTVQHEDGEGSNGRAEDDHEAEVTGTMGEEPGTSGARRRRDRKVPAWHKDYLLH